MRLFFLKIIRAQMIYNLYFNEKIINNTMLRRQAQFSPTMIFIQCIM